MVNRARLHDYRRFLTVTARHVQNSRVLHHRSVLRRGFALEVFSVTSDGGLGYLIAENRAAIAVAIKNLVNGAL
jgi:hypothetical protein